MLEGESGEPTAPEPRIGALRRAAAAIADVLVPPLCLSCHGRLSTHDALCPACWSGIDFIRAPLCDRLGLPMPYDTGGRMVSAAAAADARAVARFEGVMRTLVHDLKFHDRHDARRLFGRWLAGGGAELLVDADALVPVPLTRARLLSRRFNQSAILAHEVARITGIKVEPLALLRVRASKPQVGLSREQRRQNVAGAFAVAPGREAAIAGAKLVLVDDVITTGATAGACARVLKRAGAARVDVLALALVADAGVVAS
ncbi:MAG: ComF family protein [Methyloceanibacter sp.]